jgi:hypothetical protein
MPPLPCLDPWAARFFISVPLVCLSLVTASVATASDARTQRESGVAGAQLTARHDQRDEGAVLGNVRFAVGEPCTLQIRSKAVAGGFRFRPAKVRFRLKGPGFGRVHFLVQPPDRREVREALQAGIPVRIRVQGIFEARDGGREVLRRRIVVTRP